jgi:hypothetical protein
MHGIMLEPVILLLWLNYTPEGYDGSIDPKKAISIAESLKFQDNFGPTSTAK